MSRLGIIGPHFGAALGLVAARAGHEVMLACHCPEQATRWSRQGYGDCPRAPWLANHRFPSSLTVVRVEELVAQPPELVIIAVPIHELEGVLRLSWPQPLPQFVLVQKGITSGGLLPPQVLSSVWPKAPLLTFTGAAFAQDVAAGKPAEMLIGYCSWHEPAQRFREIWKDTPVVTHGCDDPKGLAWCNAVRPVISFQQGLLRGMIPDDDLYAIVRRAVIGEGSKLALHFGSQKHTIVANHVAGRIFRADIELCEDPGSRNYACGLALGHGRSLQEAMAGSLGVVESVRTLRTIAAQLGLALNDFPFLALALKKLG